MVLNLEIFGRKSKTVSYDEVGEELLGRGLDGAGQRGNGADGLLALEAATDDPIADDHEGGIGAGVDEGINHHLTAF